MCRASLVRDIADMPTLTDEVLGEAIGGGDLSSAIITDVDDEPEASLESIHSSRDVAI